MSRKSIEACAYLLASVLAASTAYAEASPANVASAKSLLAEGRDLRAKGDHTKARDRFKAAWALVPTPIIGLDLANEHVACGELIEAREIALEVTRLPENAKESADGKAARAEASKLASDRKTRIPSIVVKVAGVGAGKVVHATIDGEVLPSGALGAPRKVNPGTRLVVVKIDAVERRAKVTVAEGSTEEVLLDFAGPLASGEGSKDGSARPMWPWLSIGVGAVGLIGGVYFATEWVREDGIVNAPCLRTDEACRGAVSKAETGRTSSIALTIVLGGLGLAASSVGIWGLLRTSPPATGRIQPLVGLGTAGVLVRFD